MDPTSGPPPVPAVEVQELLKGGRELVIIHNDERYRLRITARGKLILTK
ncbi:hemin uptake protein HemP [Chelatococcus sp. SYSU_G07232]|uniref:Hemin uptake protein HemP n=2 Tax=Chelatococcus albus TaxID=3047466 RepID=A0ABT7AJQ7_9HYPH|nr:hemin uptake protein HemP [Chelatococcus sp. SYSU_G07232]MDJ1159602.1 hemin uptake protein HemP [Chelatococcus sp. SYSU_G07232]